MRIRIGQSSSIVRLSGEAGAVTQPVGLSTWDIKEFTGLLEELLRGQ